MLRIISIIEAILGIVLLVFTIIHFIQGNIGFGIYCLISTAFCTVAAYHFMDMYWLFKKLEGR